MNNKNLNVLHNNNLCILIEDVVLSQKSNFNNIKSLIGSCLGDKVLCLN